nr:biotin synthase BioB [Corynebacterium tapiri]
MARARETTLVTGEPLGTEDLIAILHTPDEHLAELSQLAHEVRLKHAGDLVEVEGIISLKTGGCGEDCSFCSQSGLFKESPVRSVTLDPAELVEAAKHSAKNGATEFCIVAAVRGPDDRLLDQVAVAIEAIRREVDINISASLGLLDASQAQRLRDMGVRRYNHNLETARSHFPQIVSTHAWDERLRTLELVREQGMEVCSGGIIGMGESLEQRVEFAQQLAALEPAEVPINFLDPRPGTPLANYPVPTRGEALRAIAMFRLAMPTTILRFAGGRELSLGDDGTEAGLLGGMNAIIAGNYLTTLGRPAERDLDMLDKLQLPLKVL